MARQSRFAIIVGLVLVVASTVACASSSDLVQARQDLAATKSELALAKTDLAATALWVASLEEQSKANQEAQQEAMAQVQGDLGNVTRDATALKSTVTTLQTDASKTTKDTTGLGTDMTHAENSLADLKISFGLAWDDVTKLNKDLADRTAPDPEGTKAALALMVSVVYQATISTHTLSAYSPTAEEVVVFVSVTGDSTLSTT